MIYERRSVTFPVAMFEECRWAAQNRYIRKSGDETSGEIKTFRLNTQRGICERRRIRASSENWMGEVVRNDMNCI